MSGARDAIAIECDDAQVAAALKRLLDAGRNLKPALKNIGEAMVTVTKGRFETSTGPDGKLWAPLSKARAKEKRKKGLPEKPLIAHGHLRGGIAYQLTGDGVAWGSNLVYAAIHQFGGRIDIAARSQKVAWTVKKVADQSWSDGYRHVWQFAKRAKANFERWITIGAHAIRIPARPFLGVAQTDRVLITEIVDDFLGGSVAA